MKYKQRQKVCVGIWDVNTQSIIGKLLSAQLSMYFTCYLEHFVLLNIMTNLLYPLYLSELLSQTWMKPDKEVRAPHVHLVTKRFNEVSFNF